MQCVSEEGCPRQVLGKGVSRGGTGAHQVTLVEQQDEVLVPQILADVALEMEAARAHGVARIKNLQGRRRGAMSIGEEGQQVQGVNLS